MIPENPGNNARSDASTAPGLHAGRGRIALALNADLLAALEIDADGFRLLLALRLQRAVVDPFRFLQRTWR